MVYIPMGGELDVLPVVEQALAQRKTVLLPRFDGAAGTYRAAVISNLKADLMRGPFGVMEPRPVCPVESLNQLDVTLVPGLGFDRVGRRLGRGKGHYDRMLTDASGEFWGIGHDCQLLPEVPEEAHDVVLNCIVTPASWIEVVPARR
jgi:5-formyltetrahydrofolate cyclo-ligase